MDDPADDPFAACSVCGRFASEHHEFIPTKGVPPGCKCNPRDWTTPWEIPSVCTEFIPDEENLCWTCQHQPECHQKTA